MTTLRRNVVDDDAIVNRVVPSRNPLGVRSVNVLIRSLFTDEISRTRRVNGARRSRCDPLAAYCFDSALSFFAGKLHAPLSVTALHQAVEIDVVGIEINISARDHDAAAGLDNVR